MYKLDWLSEGITASRECTHWHRLCMLTHSECWYPPPATASVLWHVFSSQRWRVRLSLLFTEPYSRPEITKQHGRLKQDIHCVGGKKKPKNQKTLNFWPFGNRSVKRSVQTNCSVSPCGEQRSHLMSRSLCIHRLAVTSTKSRSRCWFHNHRSCAIRTSSGYLFAGEDVSDLCPNVTVTQPENH